MMRMSICITLKNRAKLLAVKLAELLRMDYDPKNLEICITDGGSNDGLTALLKAYAPRFAQIRYARSDRSKLPFRVPYNNPACDINAQICHVATFNTVIRTDAEVRFGRRDSLTHIAAVLGEKRNRNKALTFPCIRLKNAYVDVPDFSHRNPKPFVDRISKHAFFCVAFDKRVFERMGGVEEKFALGFAAEDTHWHWYWKTKKRLIDANDAHSVYHVWHGMPKEMPGAKRLWKEYTMPLMKQLQHNRVKPNDGNPYWKRKSMLGEIHTWRA